MRRKSVSATGMNFDEPCFFFFYLKGKAGGGRGKVLCQYAFECFSRCWGLQNVLLTNGSSCLNLP